MGSGCGLVRWYVASVRPVVSRFVIAADTQSTGTASAKPRVLRRGTDHHHRADERPERVVGVDRTGGAVPEDAAGAVDGDRKTPSPREEHEAFGDPLGRDVTVGRQRFRGHPARLGEQRWVVRYRDCGVACGHIVHWFGVTGGGQPQNLGGALDVGGPQPCVGLEMVDPGPVVEHDVDVGRESQEPLRCQPQRRSCEIAGHGDDPVETVLGEPVPAQSRTDPLLPLVLGTRSHQAVHPQVRSVQQLAQQERAEEPGRAGQEQRTRRPDRTDGSDRLLKRDLRTEVDARPRMAGRRGSHPRRQRVHGRRLEHVTDAEPDTERVADAPDQPGHQQ